VRLLMRLAVRGLVVMMRLLVLVLVRVLRIALSVRLLVSLGVSLGVRLGIALLRVALRVTLSVGGLLVRSWWVASGLRVLLAVLRSVLGGDALVRRIGAGGSTVGRRGGRVVPGVRCCTVLRIVGRGLGLVALVRVRGRVLRVHLVVSA
jgi:hypothetical protein